MASAAVPVEIRAAERNELELRSAQQQHLAAAQKNGRQHGLVAAFDVSQVGPGTALHIEVPAAWIVGDDGVPTARYLIVAEIQAHPLAGVPPDAVAAVAQVQRGAPARAERHDEPTDDRVRHGIFGRDLGALVRFPRPPVDPRLWFPIVVWRRHPKAVLILTVDLHCRSGDPGVRDEIVIVGHTLRHCRISSGMSVYSRTGSFSQTGSWSIAGVRPVSSPAAQPG